MRTKPKTAPRLVTVALIRAAIAANLRTDDPPTLSGVAECLRHLALHRGVGLTLRQAEGIVERFGVSSRIAQGEGTRLADDAVFGPTGWVPPSWLAGWPTARVAGLAVA